MRLGDGLKADAALRGTALALLAALAAAPALAGSIMVDGRAISIPVPDGYCAIEPAVAARLPGNGDGSIRATYMVDCSELASLRYGSPIGAHALVVQVPRQFLGSGRLMTRAAAARGFTEQIIAPNRGEWTELANTRLRVLAPYDRGRNDEAIANAEVEYMDGRRLVRQGVYVAATALNGLPALVSWAWPSGRDEAAATAPRLLAYLDDLKARNPDVSALRWFNWNRSMVGGLIGGAIGLLVALLRRGLFA